MAHTFPDLYRMVEAAGPTLRKADNRNIKPKTHTTMQSYNPAVNDMSGQILAGYQTKAAETKAAGNEALAQGIMDGVSSAVTSVASAYAAGKAQDAQGKAFKEFMGITGKSLGFTSDDLEMFKSMPNSDAYQMSQVGASLLPSFFNAALYQQRAQNQAALPYHQANARILSSQPAPNQVVPTSPSAPSSTDLTMISGQEPATPYRRTKVNMAPVLGGN